MHIIGVGQGSLWHKGLGAQLVEGGLHEVLQLLSVGQVGRSAGVFGGAKELELQDLIR